MVVKRHAGLNDKSLQLRLIVEIGYQNLESWIVELSTVQSKTSRLMFEIELLVLKVDCLKL